MATVAAQDTTAPDAPSAIAVRQSGAKVVEIDLTATLPADWSHFEWYRHTSDASGSASVIGVSKNKRFHDENVAYGTTYYFWAKSVDTTGNKSGFSPSASHSVAVERIVTDDIKDVNVTTAKVVDSAVTTPKRQDVNRATSAVSHAHDTSVSKIVVSSHQVIHNLGRVVTVVAGLTSIVSETTETRFVGVFYEANNVNDFTMRVVSVSVATGPPLGFALGATLNMDYW